MILQLSYHVTLLVIIEDIVKYIICKQIKQKYDSKNVYAFFMCWLF
jgi:hypothetical protein